MKNRAAAAHSEEHGGIKHLGNHQHLLAAQLAHQHARETHHQQLSQRDGEQNAAQLAIVEMQQMFHIRNTACPTGKHQSRYKIISSHSHSLASQVAQITHSKCHPIYLLT